MPIVPTFQGGVPQVRDTGGSGATPIQQPHVGFSYDKLMQDVSRPAAEWANSLTEALRINHERTVKAESDDAERQVMDAINARMNGENGFMTMQGKNAMDAFEPTVQGMTQDIDRIVGGLQPQVREVVGSRIQDRLASAVSQARRWTNGQTQAYHMSSSQAKVDALLRDADGHYAETAYLQKTWASITQELDYQGSMMGLPAEQVKLSKDKAYDLFQARRFEAWGTDNPVQALAVFRAQKPAVSSDIAAKIESGLFTKSRDVLALGLAQAPVTLDEDGNPVEQAWTKDAGASTGDAFIDSLNTDQRLSVVLRARQLRKELKQARDDGFKAEVANSLAETRMGNNPQPLSRDQFIEAYGAKEGASQFDQYQLDREEGLFMNDARFMSDADMEQSLKDSKPKTGSANFAAEMKSYQARAKAADKIMKERRKDKIGYALANGYGQYQPLNFGNASQLREQLGYRAREMSTMADRWGGGTVLFSSQEATELVDALDKAGINDRVGLLRTIADAAGDAGIEAMSRQLKQGAANYAVAASAMTEFPDGAGISLGEMYMRGKDAVEQKRVRLDETAVLGIQGQTYSALGATEDAEAVFDDPRVLGATVELVQGVAGYKALMGSGAADAVEAAVGPIETYNGKKIVLPRNIGGWFGDDFEDLVKKQSEEVRKGKGSYFVGGVRYSSEQLAAELPKLKLQTYSRLPGGGVGYLVFRNGSTVMDAKTNEPLILEIGAQ